MMYAWITYLQVNHPNLYQQFLTDKEAARKDAGFIGMLANDQQWAAKVKQMLEVKS